MSNYSRDGQRDRKSRNLVGILSIVGFVIVFAALGYATTQNQLSVVMGDFLLLCFIALVLAISGFIASVKTDRRRYEEQKPVRDREGDTQKLQNDIAAHDLTGSESTHETRSLEEIVQQMGDGSPEWEALIHLIKQSNQQATSDQSKCSESDTQSHP